MCQQFLHFGLRRICRLFVLGISVVVGSVSGDAGQPMQVGRDGPWAFTERLEGKTNRILYMAATPAAGDSDVWLALSCGESQITASLMHNERFPFAVNQTLQLILHTEMFSDVTVSAQYVQENQFTISALTTRHIFPIFMESNRVVVTVSDSGGTTHRYEFSLQPNVLAFDGIVQHCMKQFQ